MKATKENKIIGIGSVVEIYDCDLAEKNSFTIVSIKIGKPNELSFDCTLGKSLLGKTVGERVVVKADVEYEVEILAVDNSMVQIEKTYRNIIEETIEQFPNIKIVLCEPFFLKGSATENTEEIPDRYERFLQVYDYAKVVAKLAKEYNLYFLPLQEKFNEAAKKYGEKPFLFDGVHPMIAGAGLIADAWTKLFEEKIEPSLNK